MEGVHRLRLFQGQDVELQGPLAEASALSHIAGCSHHARCLRV